MNLETIFSILTLLFLGSAITGFLLSMAVFSLANKLRANIITLLMILAIFILSWVKLAIS
jgi:hypothetical protein